MDEMFGNLPVLGAIMPEPGFILQPLGTAFGFVIDMILRAFTFLLTPVNALGFSVLIITLIVRAALIPQQMKMTRTSVRTRLARPEMDKIRAKYGNTRDPELRRKMMAEQQALNQKYGINLMSSCIPMLVTMPIFIALFGVFGRAFHFIPSINEVYTAVAVVLADLPTEGFFERGSALFEALLSVIPENLERTGFSGGAFNGRDIYDLNRAIHVFTPEHWDSIFASVYSYSPEHYPALRYAYDAKVAIEHSFGLNLVTASGWTLQSGVIIPILAAGTMAFSSWQMSRMNPPHDAQAKMMQRIMLFGLPLLFGFFTTQAATAVGLYWTMSNVLLIAQNSIVYKYFPHKIGLTEEKPEKIDRGHRDRR